MATNIDFSVDGRNVRNSLQSYSVTEEATSIDVSDSTGATPSITATFDSRARPAEIKRMRRKPISLRDANRGIIAGRAVTPAARDGMVTLTADGRTALLTVKRQAQPFSGTLGNYLIYVLSLVGITSGYVIDAALSSVPVTYMGWEEDVWLQLKRIMAVRKGEISLVSNNIVFRPARGRVTVDLRDLRYDWSVDDSDLALSVEGYVYDSKQRTNALVYPEGGWNEDVQIYQVDAGETVEFDIPINASLSSVQQPAVVDFVDRYYADASVYSVSGGDGLPVPSAQWAEGGGSVSVKIGDDTRSLIVTIVGANIDRYAPFSIAMSAGTSDKYSSLRIVGTGVFMTKTLYSWKTGVPQDVATREVGVTIDNEFITSLTQLSECMSGPMRRYGTSRQQIRVETTDVNRTGDSGSYLYPTIKDFNTQQAALGVTTIAQYTAAHPGQTINQFNAAQLALVETSFVNQLFGNVAGARTKRDGAWWRIREATIALDKISYTADEDTTISDLNSQWVGKTIAQFNAAHVGVPTINDFDVAPLEKSA